MSELEARQQTFACSFGLTLEQYKRLASSMNYTELISILELLKAHKHRSAFRASLADAVRSWLDHGVSLKPLTANQFKAIAPRWPVQYQLPT
jgi:hypothetical protein